MERRKKQINRTERFFFHFFFRCYCWFFRFQKRFRVCQSLRRMARRLEKRLLNETNRNLISFFFFYFSFHLWFACNPNITPFHSLHTPWMRYHDIKIGIYFFSPNHCLCFESRVFFFSSSSQFFFCCCHTMNVVYLLKSSIAHKCEYHFFG